MTSWKFETQRVDYKNSQDKLYEYRVFGNEGRENCDACIYIGAYIFYKDGTCNFACTGGKTTWDLPELAYVVKKIRSINKKEGK